MTDMTLVKQQYNLLREILHIHIEPVLHIQLEKMCQV
jgi:hypothetical protein